ncbi:MAG TPA: hypothetical protein VLV83_09320 [Acidobacteriota bacterium]|nr:hypothetical protein [Acidobacteriota bacterium]
MYKDVVYEKALAAAEKDIHNGYIAGFVAAIITLAVATQGRLALVAGPWLYLDVVLIAVLAWGIRQRSRTSAVLMLVYFIGAKILYLYEFGSAGFRIWDLIFAYFYARAVRGTFLYHRTLRQQEPPPKAPPVRRPVARGRSKALGVRGI